MVLSANDRHLIRALHEDKKMSVSEIVREFPNRKWHKKTVARFLKHVKETGSIERKPGSGLKPTVIPPELAESVLKMIRSKDPDTGTFFSIRKIALLSGASRRMVTKIASTDLGKPPVKKKVTAQTRLKQRLAKTKRLDLCTKLLTRFGDKEAVKKIWFSGERCFTLEKPKYVRINAGKPVENSTKAKTGGAKTKKNSAKNNKKSKENDDECKESGKDKVNEEKIEQVEKSVDSHHPDLVQIENQPGVNEKVSNDVMINNNNNNNCDMANPNNDVMNLINIYVSNPMNFVPNSNPTPNYIPDHHQSCNYTVNNYCQQQQPHHPLPAPSAPQQPQLTPIPQINSHNYPAIPSNYPPNNYNYQIGGTSSILDGNQPPQTNNMNRKGIGTNFKRSGSNQMTLNSTIQRVPNSVIVSLAVSVGGKTQPIFIDRPSGYLSADCYRREVLSRLLPIIKSQTPDFIFMQDKSTAHQSQNTVKYLEEHCPDFIKPEEWPPGCPQLHPIEYFVWKNLQSMVYRGEAIKSVDELRERIVKCWNEISQKQVDTAILQWPNKIKAAVKRAKE
ncbi:hypothetical protein CHUAL_014078 [Chamberlinius hualienensis]